MIFIGNSKTKVEVLFAFFFISLLLFGGYVFIASDAVSQKALTSKQKLLLPQLQKQLQQEKLLVPELLNQIQQQQKGVRPLPQEQQDLISELQQEMQQQQLPQATREELQAREEDGEENAGDNDDDVPSLNDMWKVLPSLSSNPSELRSGALKSALVNQTTLSQEAISQAIQGQEPINTRSPPKILFNPPSSAQPLPDNLAPVQRGCNPLLPIHPEWVTVKPYPYDTVVAEGVVTSSRINVAHHEWPFSHKSHDNNFHLLLDPKYTGLASVNHPKNENGQRTMEMEWEIGTANDGRTDRFPKTFWPWEGDRVWMMGKWVWDCSHFDPVHLNGWLSEIHPPFATAFTRNEPHQFPGESKPSSAVVTYIYLHGQGGNFNTPVGGRNYEFDINMPPRPSFLPTAQLRYDITCCFFGVNVKPIITANLKENKAHVVIPLSGIPASTSLKYGAIVAAKWVDTTRALPSSEGFRTLRVTFDSIKIIHDHDPGTSGEWNNLWVGVNGKWVELSGPSGHYGLDDVDDGDVKHFPAGKSVIVTVPEKGELKIQTTGWEDDNDGYYGHGYLWYLALPLWSPIGPSKLGALNDNDPTGIILTRYCSVSIEDRCSGNFGIGRHNDLSVEGHGAKGGDFELRYHIEQLSITAPTTPPTAQLPTPPSPRPPAQLPTTPIR
jgi:hypothetical protein